MTSSDAPAEGTMLGPVLGNQGCGAEVFSGLATLLWRDTTIRVHFRSFSGGC